jgi:transposase
MMFSIGIDVGQKNLDIAVLRCADQKVVTTFKVENNQTGHQQLIKQLRGFCDARVIFEATSSYHYGAVFALRDAGLETIVVNPLITRKYTKSSIRKTKTDKEDSKLLARIGIVEAPDNLKIYLETKTQIQIKQLSKVIQKMKQERRIFIQKLNQEKIIDAEVIPLGSVCESLQTIIVTMGQEIQKLTKELTRLAGEDAKLIESIPGVGLETAAAIVAELGDLSRFKNKNQITAFAGLDPSIRESGSSVRGRSHITKRGSANLRCVLSHGAWGLMMHNPSFKEYYAKKKAEGKHYYSILTAIARKLLILSYALLKTRKTYTCQSQPT